MGYRSEVSYVIRFESKEVMDTFIGVQLCKKNGIINEALKELAIVEGADPVIFFHAYDVKWYDDYEDVKAHMDLIDDAVDKYKADALFLRCGDDADDLDEEAYGENGVDLYEYISVNRPSICIDTGNTKPILNENNELQES
jgi:hypothetical protein